MFYNLISTIQFAKGDDRMSFLDKTFQTHLNNIQKKTDKSTDQVLNEIYSDANEVNSELVAWIKSAYESAG